MSNRPKHVYALPRGGVYFWNRAAGTSKITMQHAPGEPGFEGEYHSLMAKMANKTISLQRSHRQRRADYIESAEGSIGELCIAYFASDKFLRLLPSTRLDKKRYVEACLKTVVKAEPLAGRPERNGEAHPFGEWKVDRAYQHDAETLRRNLPGRVRPTRLSDADDGQFRDAHMVAMRSVFHWGVAKSRCRFNPFARLEPLVNVEEREGWYAWSDDDIAAFKRRYPLGTMQHLALMLLLHIVVRRSDVARFGAPMVTRGALHFVEAKGRAKRRKEAAVKLPPELRAAIDAVPGAWDRPTFLVNQENGRPFTPCNFSHHFGVWCDEVFGRPGGKNALRVDRHGKRQRTRERRPTKDGLPARSAHGVRKYVLTRGAEAGRSERQLAAMLGHTTTKHVGKYVKRAERSKLFASAMEGLL